MCTNTTSACVFPFYLPIETDELQPAQMISYLPVTFYLCASSFSNSHGAQIKKRNIRNKSFSKIRWRRESWHVLVITIHYPQSPIPKSSFCCCVHTLKTQHVLLVQTWQQKQNQKQIFKYFLHNIQAHTPNIITYHNIHTILHYTPYHSICPLSVLFSD